MGKPLFTVSIFFNLQRYIEVGIEVPEDYEGDAVEYVMDQAWEIADQGGDSDFLGLQQAGMLICDRTEGDSNQRPYVDMPELFAGNTWPPYNGIDCYSECARDLAAEAMECLEKIEENPRNLPKELAKALELARKHIELTHKK